jgi:hypothetical protein
VKRRAKEGLRRENRVTGGLSESSVKKCEEPKTRLRRKRVAGGLSGGDPPEPLMSVRERSEHKDGARLQRKVVAGGLSGGDPPNPPPISVRSHMCSAAHVLGRACARPRMCSAAHVRTWPRMCSAAHVLVRACARPHMGSAINVLGRTCRSYMHPHPPCYRRGRTARAHPQLTLPLPLASLVARSQVQLPNGRGGRGVPAARRLPRRGGEAAGAYDSVPARGHGGRRALLGEDVERHCQWYGNRATTATNRGAQHTHTRTYTHRPCHAQVWSR